MQQAITFKNKRLMRNAGFDVSDDLWLNRFFSSADLNKLLDAAREQGRAEGAESERAFPRSEDWT